MTVPDKIETTLHLHHPPEKVWQAITTPAGLNQWFGDRVQMSLHEGTPIRFEWDAYGSASGIIETIIPLTRFVYRWRAHGISEETPMTPANSTVVSFELEQNQAGTILRVIETGFANLPPELRERAHRENSSGWNVELQELVDFLTGSA